MRLVSFAVHWIRAEIHEFVLRNWRLVRVATTKAQRKLFFNLRKAKKHLGWLSKDGGRGGRSRSRRDHARRRGNGEAVERPRRLVRPLSRGRRRIRAVDVLCRARTAIRRTPSSATTADADDHDRLAAALGKLDERSRMILSRRWLADNKATLHELAAEYGVSAERIRQIEANAIAKLKKQLAAA